MTVKGAAFIIGMGLAAGIAGQAKAASPAGFLPAAPMSTVIQPLLMGSFLARPSMKVKASSITKGLETTFSNMGEKIATEFAPLVLASVSAEGAGAQSMNFSGVFRSVSIPFAKLPIKRMWNQVHPAVDAADFSCDSSACGNNDPRLAAILSGLDGLSFKAKIDRINKAVNRRVTYTPDQQQFGKNDIWIKPGQTLATGRGDCEDYAILKMALLAKIGIPTSSMSIVVVRDTKRNLFHAVLAVSTSKGHFILDNLREKAALDTSYDNYQPIYSLSENRSWIHGRKVGEPALAAGPAPVDATPG